MTISRMLTARIAAHAGSSADEVCGLLLGDHDTVYDVIACANVAADPARRFEIDPAALIAAHRSARTGGMHVIGHYHSHPNGSPVPSACDATQAPPDGAVWLIVARDVVHAWRAVVDGTVEGRFDPVSLTIGD